MEVTKKEFENQMNAYRQAGLAITEAPGVLGQVYFLANGQRWCNARVGRYTGATYHLDNPLNLSAKMGGKQ